VDLLWQRRLVVLLLLLLLWWWWQRCSSAQLSLHLMLPMLLALQGACWGLLS
jgi:hypothetical protein